MKTVKTLFFIIGICVSIYSQAQTKLSFNPEVGKTYQFTTKTTQTGNATISGQSIPLNTIVDMSFDMKTMSKTPDEIRMQYSYKNISLILNTSVITLKVDTQNPSAVSSEQEKTLSQLLGKMVNKSFDIVFKPDGSVVSLNGLNSIMKEMLSSLPNSSNSQTSTSLLESLNDETMKKMFEQTFKMYPEQAVKRGDSWSGSASISVSSIKSDVQNTYILKNVKGDIAFIDVSSNFSMGPVAGIEMDLKGNQVGAIEMDIKTGLPLKSELNQTINGKIKMQDKEILLDMVNNTLSTLQNK
jgi:hypothetical protein